MKIRKLAAKTLARHVLKMFGKEAKFQRNGDYCFVHLDDPPPELMAVRAETFEPTHFFDPTCPHCRPFLEDGAFMIYAADELVGMRLRGHGMFETVLLRRPEQAVAAN
jgi:hypothetical protein